MVNFRYRVEIEGEETVWMWHRDAAVSKIIAACSPSGTRNGQVIDEETGQVIVSRKKETSTQDST